MLRRRSNRKKKPSLSDLIKREAEQRFDKHDWDELKKRKVSANLEENKAFLKDLFHDCSDLVFREFQIDKTDSKALLIFVDGMINSELVDLSLLNSLLIQEGGTNDITELEKRVINATQLTKADDFANLVRQLLNGDTILFVEGNDTALVVSLRGAEHRNVTEPETESVIRGPREGFTENLRTNTALIRRKLKTPRLKMKSVIVGRESQTNLAVAFLEGIVSPDLVAEVLARLDKIDIDGVFESGNIEDLIQDDFWSPFPQIMNTERPDTVAAYLLEGRVAILVDGTPFVLIAPTTFWQFLQTPEDYYGRWHITTMLRLLRTFFMGVALFTPAFYIAVTTYHPEMLPTTLLLSVAASREAIPFPAVVEALIMEISYEALGEAGVRLPRTVGQTLSILGAIVVGQAAVQAGIVSAPMVLLVSLTGIAAFVIPRFHLSVSIRLLRFPLMILAAFLGIFGIILGFMFILAHLCGLRSFGIPYFGPIGPIIYKNLSDTVVRAPLWQNRERPVQLNEQNPVRVGDEMAQDIARQGGMKGEKEGE